MDGAIMYWLMLCAGIAAPLMASAQSRLQELEPDYTQGYERPDSERTHWPWMAPGQGPSSDEAWPEQGRGEVPWTQRSPARDSDVGATGYRFRGDPLPSGGGPQAAEPYLEFRFRPLTPGERERQGPTTRWRPTDEDRRGRPLDPTERSTLFDTLVPDRPLPPDPWRYE